MLTFGLNYIFDITTKTHFQAAFKIAVQTIFYLKTLPSGEFLKVPGNVGNLSCQKYCFNAVFSQPYTYRKFYSKDTFSLIWKLGVNLTRTVNVGDSKRKVRDFNKNNLSNNLLKS
jgi:hypothetical protein